MIKQTTSPSIMTDKEFDAMIDNMTDEQFDKFMAACFDDVNIFPELSGDNYADAVLADLKNY